MLILLIIINIMSNNICMFSLFHVTFVYFYYMIKGVYPECFTALLHGYTYSVCPFNKVIFLKMLNACISLSLSLSLSCLYVCVCVCV